MNEKIKKILGEELSRQVSEKLGDVEIGITNDGTLVSAEKHDKMKAEYKATQKQLDSVQEQLKGFDDSNTTIEDLKAKLEESNNSFEQFKKDTEKRESNFNKLTKLKESMAKKFNADAIDLLASTINLEELQLNEAGEIVDVDVKLDRIAENRPSLKLNTEPNTPKPPSGGTPQGEPDFSKMTDAEYFSYQAQHKEE